MLVCDFLFPLPHYFQSDMSTAEGLTVQSRLFFLS